MEQTLAGLGNRVFLMNNVHDDAPVVFETRWAMSYLRGPLTRNQIKQLMDPVRGSRAALGLQRPRHPRRPAPGPGAESRRHRLAPRAPAGAAARVCPSALPR